MNHQSEPGPNPGPDRAGVPGDDIAVVAELLGRRPQGRFEVVVRRDNGAPVVIANDPFLDSGRPMPTRFWLVDPLLNKAIGTLESTGAVDRVEAEIPPGELAAVHAAYAAERDQLIPDGHEGPRPSGGVGGTRVGVKCLHAHYAHLLAGGDDPVGRWVHARLTETGDAFQASSPTRPGTESGGAAAVIEIGSGAVKLVVSDDDARRSESIPTGLARSVDGAGAVDPAAANRVSAAVGELSNRAGALGIPLVGVIGTAAVRAMATADRRVLAQAVRDETGCELEVLSGDAEAELGLVAAEQGADQHGDNGPLVTIDIGAGSTELATRTPDGTQTFSFPVGAVTVTEQYLHGDPPGPDELSAALSVIELYFTDLRREAPSIVEAIETGTVVGLGSVTTIARVEIGLVDTGESVDGYRLAREAAEEVFRALATEPAEDRAFNPGLPPIHVDDIVGALCLLVEFMRQFAVAELVVSERSPADGRLAQALGSTAR